MQLRTLFAVGVFGFILCAPAIGDEPLVAEPQIESVEAEAISEETLLANARVREVIAAMNDAIEAGDVGAYMSHIDPSQAVFLTEQRAWITDSILEGVRELEYTFFAGMGDGASQRSETEIWAAIGIGWNLVDEQESLSNTPDWKMVYIARFVPLGSPDGPWMFAGPEWHFDLYDEATNVRVLATEDHESNAQLALERAPRSSLWSKKTSART